MGQQEVIEILKKEGIPLSRTEIADKLDWHKTKASMVLRRILNDPFSEIKAKRIDRKKALKIYGSPRTMQLFYYEETIEVNR